MSEIIARSIGKRYGINEVLKDVSVRLAKGDRIGLVGPNGEGKTTLLKILSLLEEPTTGEVSHRRALRVGYLPQDPPASSELTLHDSMLAVFADLYEVEAQLHEVAEQLEKEPADRELLKRYGVLQMEFEACGGYGIETRIKTVLTGLGFNEGQHTMPLVHLSGGQRSRAMLAGLLLAEPDVLLLDEPTNHLDLVAIEWMEGWLRDFRGTLVIVSHDRYLLDRTIRKVWEVCFARLEEYRGNYTDYVGLRERRRAERLEQWQKQQDYVAKTEEYIRRYHAGQRSREARGRRARLDRFLEEEAIERPRNQKSIRVRLDPADDTGHLILRVRGLVVGYEPEAPLLRVPDMEVHRGDRLAVIGPNGSGKTSLVRTLLGWVEPLGGKVRVGSRVKLGYMPQTHDALDADETALGTVIASTPDINPSAARSLLGSFLFHGDEVKQKISELSGGQRSRVVLACLVAQGANVLVLDEPTNHLDIPSQEILQEVLQDFRGTVIVVSHDRYLVQALATRVLVIEGGDVHPVKGGWEAYLRWRARCEDDVRKDDEPVVAADEGAALNGRERRKLRQEQRRLEREIERTESRLEELGAAINVAAAASDSGRVRELGREYAAGDRRLAELWREYETVTGRLEP